MAKINRENVKVFAGSSNTAQEFGVVGSFARHNPQVASTAPMPPTAELIETIGNIAYDKGLSNIVEDGQQLPTMEEFNSLFYLFTKWIKYGYQEGVAEYSPNEIYYPRSIVKYNGRLYQAIQSNANGFSGVAPDAPNAAGYWGRLYLASNSVDEDTINDRVVTERKLADNSVSERTIQNGAVTSAKIGNGAVTVPNLGQDVLDLIEDMSVETIRLNEITQGNFSLTPSFVRYGKLVILSAKIFNPSGTSVNTVDLQLPNNWSVSNFDLYSIYFSEKITGTANIYIEFDDSNNLQIHNYSNFDSGVSLITTLNLSFIID